MLRHLPWASVVLAGCFSPSTLRTGKLRSEKVFSVAVPIYSGTMAKAPEPSADCALCQTSECRSKCEVVDTSMPALLDPIPVANLRVSERGEWLELGGGLTTANVVAVHAFARLRLVEHTLFAMALAIDAGGGISFWHVGWYRASLGISVSPTPWLSVYGAPHIGQWGQNIGGDSLGSIMRGIDAGIRWQLTSTAALYTECGWTQSAETGHSVLMPTIGLALPLSAD